MDEEPVRAPGLSPAVRAVIILAAGILVLAGLLAVTLAVLLRHTTKVVGGDPSKTQAVFREFQSAVKRLRLPDGYTLIHIERGGSVGGLFNDQSPYELRMYSADARSSAVEELKKAMATAGFTVKPGFRCSFDARRGPIVWFVVFQRSAEPYSNDQGGCPSETWPHVYAWTVLYQASDEGPQPPSPRSTR
jgi:hypothetical protein